MLENCKYWTAAVVFVLFHLISALLIDSYYCIPGRKLGILGFSTVMPPPQRFPFGRDNIKNILVRPFKFGIWVYMGNATNAIVL